MHQVPRSSLVRTLALSVAVVGAFAATALTLPSCQMVDDTLLGVSVSGRNQEARACLRDCQDARQSARKNENERHKVAARACRDPICSALEEARHEAALIEIEQQFVACKDQCHHQGGSDNSE